MVRTRPSPLRPARFPNCLPVPGVSLATAATGSRYRGRDDLFCARFAEGTEAAGLFTRSSVTAAPVDWSRRVLAKTGAEVRGLVVNAGNANAFTGRAGEAACARLAGAYAAKLGARPEAVLVASTGVIGEPLDPAPIVAAFDGLAWRSNSWQAAAQAIGTTDTFPKGATAIARIDGTEVVLTGIAKGSGMIHPQMATMLAFVFTNARLPAAVLDPLLRAGAETSFHAITVDGDSSTNDALILFATGTGARHDAITHAADPRLDDFRRCLDALLVDLAQQIVHDGEGAEKFVTIAVTGAESDAAAKRIAFAIATSPLVKTAIAGADPNWGRIVMAIGKSGERVDREGLRIWLGAQPVAAGGERHPAYSEQAAATHMQGREIEIRAEIGVGAGSATVWTCDLTHGYIDINADYRS
ncbi:MAG: bifunctional glutamate N-acetyltransferase/amino-acid acetyltransferase ArgJ [Rhodothalassiaceae bacterium]